MTVTVKPHDYLKPNWTSYVRSLPGTSVEQAELARERWNEFVATITAAQGPPPGAVPDGTRFPNSYWCSFPGGLLVLVHFRAPHRAGLFRWVQEALAVDMNFSPGASG
jgi:hypothetical protein